MNANGRVLWVALVITGTAMGAYAYPAAEGFDAEGSDARAIELADLTMQAMGGYEAWAATRYLTWSFGNKRHVWDKHTGRYRMTRGELVVLMNVVTGEGKAWRKGEPITDAEQLAGALRQAKGAWINDGYWLLMPYKLKDSGVTLKYVGERETLDGRTADVVRLTFKRVGRTPQNAYHAYIDRESRLVRQWDFFAKANNKKPNFQGMWTGWRWHGPIKLSNFRGKQPGQNDRMKDLGVFIDLPDAVFEDPAPVDLDDIGQRAENEKEDTPTTQPTTTQPATTQPATTRPSDQ